MFLYCGFLGLILVHPAVSIDLMPFKDELRIETILALNTSQGDYKPLKLSELNGMVENSRKYIWGWWLIRQRHLTSPEYMWRTCTLLTMTFFGVMDEMHVYYPIRYLYITSADYEIGYLTYEIVWRYQMMIELYQIVHNRYYYHPHRLFTPVPYMMYMYGLMLDQGIMIFHLVNMLHEIEEKYSSDQSKKVGVFDDYPENVTIRVRRTTTPPYVDDAEPETETVATTTDYVAKKEEEYKKRKKERKEKRKKEEEFGYIQEFTPPRGVKPYKSKWPLEYGWSIEFW